MAADSANLALPPWRGLHHVALVTRDLDATMRLYAEVLGMEIMVVAPAGERHGRHCSIQPGRGSSPVVPAYHWTSGRQLSRKCYLQSFI